MKIKQLSSPSETFDVEFPRDKPFDVVGFGTNSVDYLCLVAEYPRLDSKIDILQYERLPGGQVATTCAFVSRMGLKAKYVGKTGDDDNGRFALETFRNDSIDTASVLVAPDTRNQFAVIIIDGKSGERTVLSQRDSGLDFGERELEKEAVCCGRVLHLDGYDTRAAIRAATWCREAGIPVVIDLDKVVDNCCELIAKVDFLIVSSNFPCEFTGRRDPAEALAALADCHEGFLAVTMGAAGAVAWVDGRGVRFPGIRVDAKDTTGAGDVFHGGFIYGLLQNWPLEKIMRFANTAAGLSCLSLGARSGIRPPGEILSFMQEHP